MIPLIYMLRVIIDYLHSFCLMSQKESKRHFAATLFGDMLLIRKLKQKKRSIRFLFVFDAFLSLHISRLQS